MKCSRTMRSWVPMLATVTATLAGPSSAHPLLAQAPTIRNVIGMELVLEGLTQHLKIAREDLDSRVSYGEMLKFNLVRSRTT